MEKKLSSLEVNRPYKFEWKAKSPDKSFWDTSFLGVLICAAGNSLEIWPPSGRPEEHLCEKAESRLVSVTPVSEQAFEQAIRKELSNARERTLSASADEERVEQFLLTYRSEISLIGRLKRFLLCQEGVKL